MRRAILAYLRLRATTLGRQIWEVGWWRLLLLVPLLLLAAGNVLLFLARHTTAYWLVPPLMALLLLAPHRRRADITFLRLIGPQYRAWLAAEYALLAGPGMIALLVYGHWVASLLTAFAAALVALVPAAQAVTQLFHRRSAFRSEALEWVSGFRQTGAWVWWLLLVGAAAWWRQYPLASALALAVWLIVLVGCYGTPEHWSLLLPALRTPGAWLRRRVALAVVYGGVTAAPWLWLMATGPAGPGATTGLALAGVVLLSMAVLARYAFYPNALLVRLTQGAILAVALLMAANPVYPALLLVAFGGLLWKSRRQLATFRPDEILDQTGHRQRV